MSGRKYRLTDETRTLDDGTVLHRIEALRDGHWGLAGARGGWVQSEANLSHAGSCWIWDEATVMEDADVRDDADVSGHAVVRGYARVRDWAVVDDEAWVTGYAVVADRIVLRERARITAGVLRGEFVIRGRAAIEASHHWLAIGPIGSRHDTLLAYRCADDSWTVATGCYAGSIEAFDAAVAATHGDSPIGRQYRLAASLIRDRMRLADARAAEGVPHA
jgi:hypothetical protein